MLRNPRFPDSVTRSWNELSQLYLGLLAVTAIFKTLYLSALYNGGVLHGLGLSGGPRPIALVQGALLVFPADAIQVAGLTLLIYALGRGIVRLSFRKLLRVTLVIAACWGLLNWFTALQIHTLLSRDVAIASWQWLTSHPLVAASFFPAPPGTNALPALVVIAFGVWVAFRLLPFSFGSFSGRALSILAPAVFVSAGILEIARPSGRIGVATKPYWSATVAALVTEDPLALPAGGVPSLADLRSLYTKVAYPVSRPVSASHVSATGRDSTAKRFIVVIVLETAPLAYYRIVDNPQFPNFLELGRRGIVNEHHYSTMPYTTESIFSIVTGLYPMPRVESRVHAVSSRPSFLSMLSSRGYEASFVDSYEEADWSAAQHELWKTMGFQKVFAAPIDTDSYEGAIRIEEQSFARGLAQIDSARLHQHGAFVVIATALGHYPWKAPTNSPASSPTARLANLVTELDRMVGELTASLEKRGILNDAIIVVTGDHGPRIAREFESLAANPRDMELTYNVPLILFAPGAIDHTVRLSYATSHVDLAPTILALANIPSDSILLHGQNLLEYDLQFRATYNIDWWYSAVQSFVLGDRRYTANDLTGETENRPVGDSKNPLTTSVRTALAPARVAQLVRDSKIMIAASFAYQFR